MNKRAIFLFSHPPLSSHYFPLHLSIPLKHWWNALVCLCQWLHVCICVCFGVHVLKGDLDERVLNSPHCNQYLSKECPTEWNMLPSPKAAAHTQTRGQDCPAEQWFIIGNWSKCYGLQGFLPGGLTRSSDMIPWAAFSESLFLLPFLTSSPSLAWFFPASVSLLCCSEALFPFPLLPPASIHHPPRSLCVCGYRLCGARVFQHHGT